MIPIELETEIQFVRRGIYLKSHPEMKDAEKKFLELKNAGWRNPIGDYEFVLGKYKCRSLSLSAETIAQNCRIAKEHIYRAFYEDLESEWARDMHYGKILTKDKNNTPSLFLAIDGWMAILPAPFRLGGTAGRRRNCRRCDRAIKTAYHVSSSCLTDTLMSRHDEDVHWLIKSVLLSQTAP